ncbi:hypothetical protein ACTPD5_21350, partial [Clostridioides difficile]
MGKVIEILNNSNNAMLLKDSISTLNYISKKVNRDDITIYHKLAIKDMAKGDKVTKYGEHIGEANQEIKSGQHVHI